MNNLFIAMARTACCLTAMGLAAGSWFNLPQACAAEKRPASQPGQYQFDRTISREVLENYLSRAISMEGLLNGRGDLEDNIRMLKSIGAKFIGRSLCLWGGEADLLSNLDRAKQQLPKVHQADPEMILQACIFEIVTAQVEQVPVPDWAFTALGQPVEKRSFRYADMLYPDGRRRDQWGRNGSVPDVSRPETKLWFYFLAASFIDLGIEAIHFGQTELMNGNDRNLDHYSQVLTLIRSWGYDEITWFGHQSDQYRSDWLRYAWDWVRRTDSNSHLEMPGSRTLVSPLDHKRWYYANKPSPAVPEGFGDEEAIRAIWAADAARP